MDFQAKISIFLLKIVVMNPYSWFVKINFQKKEVQRQFDTFFDENKQPYQ